MHVYPNPVTYVFFIHVCTYIWLTNGVNTGKKDFFDVYAHPGFSCTYQTDHSGRDGTIVNIIESMQYYMIQYCYHLYIALNDNIRKAVILLVI